MYSIYPWKHLRTHHFASSKKKDPLSKVWLLALQKMLATPLIINKFHEMHSGTRGRVNKRGNVNILSGYLFLWRTTNDHSNTPFLTKIRWKFSFTHKDRGRVVYDSSVQPVNCPFFGLNPYKLSLVTCHFIRVLIGLRSWGYFPMYGIWK